jgi:hypothetical protein
MIFRATSKFTPGRNAGQFISAVIIPGMVDGLTVSGSRLLANAQLIAHEDTGDLRDSGSLSVESEGTKVTASIVFDSDHAAYNEFGTGIRGAASEGAGPYPYDLNWPGMAAIPFLRPAADEEKPNVPAAISEGIAGRLAE